MQKNLEPNKIFAAVLVAGILFMLSGFLADLLIHEEKLEEPSYPIEGVERASMGAAPAAAPSVDPIFHLLALADTATGEKLSRQCAACHTFSKGGANKIGPNLWGVVGREKAQVSGFNYSDALQEKEGSWNYDSLNRFLWRPDKYVPGTKMNFVGIKQPEKRAALIAWMRTMADTPEPLPTEEEIVAEKEKLSPQEESSEGGAEDSPSSAESDDKTTSSPTAASPGAEENQSETAPEK